MGRQKDLTSISIKDLKSIGIVIRPLQWDDSPVIGLESDTPIGKYYIWHGFDGDWHWSLNSNVSMGRCRDLSGAETACGEHLASVILKLLQRE